MLSTSLKGFITLNNPFSRRRSGCLLGIHYPVSEQTADSAHQLPSKQSPSSVFIIITHQLSLSVVSSFFHYIVIVVITITINFNHPHLPFVIDLSIIRYDIIVIITITIISGQNHRTPHQLSSTKSPPFVSTISHIHLSSSSLFITSTITIITIIATIGYRHHQWLECHIICYQQSHFHQLPLSVLITLFRQHYQLTYRSS